MQKLYTGYNNMRTKELYLHSLDGESLATITAVLCIVLINNRGASKPFNYMQSISEHHV